MPLFTITTRTGRRLFSKSEISAAIHIANMAAGYSENDKFQRFLCLDPDNFVIDPNYPGLPNPRTENFLIIEVLLSSGTDPGKKHTLRSEIVKQLNLVGVSPIDVMVLFTEVDPAFSSYGNGEPAPPVLGQ